MGCSIHQFTSTTGLQQTTWHSRRFLNCPSPWGCKYCTNKDYLCIVQLSLHCLAFAWDVLQNGLVTFLPFMFCSLSQLHSMFNWTAMWHWGSMPRLSCKITGLSQSQANFMWENLPLIRFTAPSLLQPTASTTLQLMSISSTTNHKRPARKKIFMSLCLYASTEIVRTMRKYNYITFALLFDYQHPMCLFYVYSVYAYFCNMCADEMSDFFLSTVHYRVQLGSLMNTSVCL